ncbi:MAG: ABC transporter ATP-binding protein [Ilumatobacteraceae bacterium]|jgi:putative spermidine/putrescine transport system ATP-binding protein
MTSLEFSSIRKCFGPTVALADFDLTIAPGEFISLLGPSGCGKTTALRIAAGFERADAGTVSLGGHELSPIPAHKRNMGMVFQSYSLFPNLDVRKNVAFGLKTRRLESSVIARRVDEMLEIVQLSGLGDRFPHQLSGGQQQRVALARALAVRPEVLLLDEPLSALDARVRSTLRDEIKRIQRDTGVTTLFVTHDQDEALAMSDRVGVMSEGRLEQVGSPHEVYQSPASPFVARFVGSINEIPSEQGTILVRPEALTIHENVLHGKWIGTVVASTFQGPSTLIDVRLDALDLLVRVHAPTGTYDGVAGSRVSISMVGDHLLAV